MPKTNIPSYRLHKASGQAFIELDGRRFYLGKHGSKASKDEYERRLGEYLSNNRKLPPTRTNGSEMRKEYFITCFLKNHPVCRTPKGREEQNKSCFDHAESPVLIDLGGDGGEKLIYFEDECTYNPIDEESEECTGFMLDEVCVEVCPYVCTTLHCPEVSSYAVHRCSLVELDEEEKEHLENEVGIEDHLGRKLAVFWDREYELQSAEELGLTTTKNRIAHNELLDEFDKRPKSMPPTVESEVEANRIYRSMTQTDYMVKCQKLADKIKNVRVVLPDSTAPVVFAEQSTQQPNPPISKPKVAGTPPKETAEKKLRRFYLEHPECRSWSAPKIGKAIDETAENIRKAETWKLYSNERKAIAEENKRILQQNNERLPAHKRKQFEKESEEPDFYFRYDEDERENDNVNVNSRRFSRSKKS